MNSLSWLIYLSEVVPSFSTLFGIAAFFVMAIGAGFLIYGGHEREMAYFDVPGIGADARRRSRDTPRWQSGYSIQKRALRVIPVAFLFVLAAIAVPSKQTILMIAASEMGETVIKTPEAQEVFTDLKAILKKQLEEMKK